MGKTLIWHQTERFLVWEAILSAFNSEIVWVSAMIYVTEFFEENVRIWFGLIRQKTVMHERFLWCDNGVHLKSNLFIQAVRKGTQKDSGERTKTYMIEKTCLLSTPTGIQVICEFLYITCACSACIDVPKLYQSFRLYLQRVWRTSDEKLCLVHNRWGNMARRLLSRRAGLTRTPCSRNPFIFVC